MYEFGSRWFYGKQISHFAKIGAEEPADNNSEVSFKDLTSIFKEDAWKNTQSKIDNESNHKGKFYFTNFYDDNKKQPWFREFNMERYHVTLIKN